ncbi:MAG: mechanosensitive ion channel family protein [Thiolinea sp.]
MPEASLKFTAARSGWLLCAVLSLLLLSAPDRFAAADELNKLLTGQAAAEETAAATEKVITTDSSIQDDRKIRQRLRDIFAELDNLKNVTIDVNKGVITLSGEVDSAATEEKALQFARQIEGVVEVENELTINRSVRTRLGNTLEKLQKLGQQLISGLPLLLMALLVFVLFWWMGRWLARQQQFYRKLTPNYFIANLLGQITHLIFVVLGIMLALILLDATALIGTILGAAGIVGLAVGFAVRDTVENYIASILLSIRNPFEMNDFVNVDGHEGNVLRLTSRATVLISPDGNHIRIPNALVFKAVITNFTRHPERRFQFDVGVDTEQDLLAAQALALQTLKQTAGVLTEPLPSVIIEQLGDSNVLLRIFAWVDQDQSNFAKVRSEAIRAVKLAFDQAGIVMPEPIYKLRLMQENTDIETGTGLPAVSASAADTAPKPVAPPVQVQHSNTAEVQDVSPDRTVENRVKEEQAEQSDGENLLNRSAPKE